MKKSISIILVLVIIVVIAVAFSRKSHESESLVKESNAVVIADQNSQNTADAIKISYAKLSKPGFVVVSSKDTATGQTVVVGSSELLPAGEHINVVVRRASKRSSTATLPELVTATIVADNGDSLYSTDDELLLTDDLSATVSDDAVISNDVDQILEDLSMEEVLGQLKESKYTLNEDSDVIEDNGQDNIIVPEKFDDGTDDSTLESLSEEDSI